MDTFCTETTKFQTTCQLIHTVSPGVKFKDAELIGVPLVAVVGRDYVNDGTIELRDRNGENKVAVPAAEAADALAERFAALS